MVVPLRGGCPEYLDKLQMDQRCGISRKRRGEAGTLAATWMRMRASLPLIVGIAFALRLCWIVIGHTYRFKTTDDNFSFGWEMGRIAASIAVGPRIQQSLWPADRADGMGTSLVPISGCGSISSVWNLFDSIRFRAAKRE